MNTNQLQQLTSSIEAGKLAHNSPYSDVRDAVQDTLDIVLLALSNVTQPETNKLTLHVTEDELDTLRQGINALSAEGSLNTTDTRGMLNLLKIPK